MLTDGEIKVIEAEGYLDGPVPALLADRQELLALAKELAEALNWVAYHRTYDREHMGAALDKASSAGLLEDDNAAD